MIATIIYGPEVFEENEELQHIADSIRAYDEENYTVRHEGHNFFISDGGIKVTLHYVNEKVPAFLRRLKPTRVQVRDNTRARCGKFVGERITPGYYEFGQSTAHVDNVYMEDGSVLTKINIESRSVRSGITLLRRLRSLAIEPKQKWTD